MKKASAIIISAAMAAIMALGTGCGAAGERPEHNTQASAPAPSAAIVATEIAPSDFEYYGVDEHAETAYTLTATVYPVSASDKTVDWTIAWANAESTWATGKTVTDYVTAQAQADGSTVCIVSCLQAFGEQIEVTVTARANENATATCTLDYVKRIVNAPTRFSIKNNELPAFTGGGAGQPMLPNFQASAPSVAFDITTGDTFTTTLTASELIDYDAEWEEGHLGVGTLDDEYVYSWEVRSTDEFHAKAREVLGGRGSITNYAVKSSTDQLAVGTGTEVTFTRTLDRLYRLIYSGYNSKDYELHKDELQAVYTACVDAGIPFATATLTVTGLKSSYTVSIDFFFSQNCDLYATAQSVEMSDSNVTF